MFAKIPIEELNIPCEADSWVGQYYPDQNHGTDGKLIASSQPGANEFYFLRYNVTALAGKTLLEARVYLWYHGAYCSTGLWGYLECRSVDDDTWGELTITWNNKPAAGGVLDTYIREWPAEKWISFNVMAWLQTQLGGKASFRFNTQTGTTGTQCSSSKEGYTPNYLYVKYQ